MRVFEGVPQTAKCILNNVKVKVKVYVYSNESSSKCTKF